MTQAIEPGWKQDPVDPGMIRWWDGQNWTAHTQPAQKPVVAAHPMSATDTQVMHQPAQTTAVQPVQRVQPVQLVQPVAQQSPQVIVNQINSSVEHSGGTTGARSDVKPFYFNGGAATYVGTAILATLITIFSAGILFPFALVLRERWKAKHTYIEGRRLVFTGTGMGLFGNWLKWFALCIITLGIYAFWVQPRLTKWRMENLAFDPSYRT